MSLETYSKLKHEEMNGSKVNKILYEAEIGLFFNIKVRHTRLFLTVLEPILIPISSPPRCMWVVVTLRKQQVT